MMTALSTETGKRKDMSPPDSVGGMELTHPSGMKRLMNPKTSLSEVSSPLRWLSLLMVLYYHGLPLSVLGSWFSVHKTTVLRFLLGANQELCPIVSHRGEGKVPHHREHPPHPNPLLPLLCHFVASPPTRGGEIRKGFDGGEEK